MFLKTLFNSYFSEIGALRQQKLDLDNVQFNSQYELRLKVPESWNVNEQLLYAIRESNINFSSMFVFYSDTQSYRKFYDMIESESANDVKFRSYFEFYAAIMNSSHDIRGQQAIVSEVGLASVVVVVDVTKCPDLVLNAIRQATDGRLILIG